jgi:hypothetical protein
VPYGYSAGRWIEPGLLNWLPPATQATSPNAAKPHSPKLGTAGGKEVEVPHISLPMPHLPLVYPNLALL